MAAKQKMFKGIGLWKLMCSALMFGLVANSSIAVASEKIDTSGFSSSVIWDSNGAPVDLSAIRGRNVVVSFYASWCAECMKEVADLNKLATSGSGKFDVIAISLDNDTAKARLFAQRTGMKYHNLVGGEIAKGMMLGLGNKKKAVPFTVALDKSGSLKFSKIGAFELSDIEKSFNN